MKRKTPKKNPAGPPTCKSLGIKTKEEVLREKEKKPNWFKNYKKAQLESMGFDKTPLSGSLRDITKAKKPIREGEKHYVQDLAEKVSSGKMTRERACELIGMNLSNERSATFELDKSIRDEFKRKDREEKWQREKRKEAEREHPELKFAGEWLKLFETKVKLGEIGEKNAIKELKRKGIEGEEVENALRKAQETYLTPLARKMERQKLEQQIINEKRDIIKEGALQSTLKLYSEGLLDKELAQKAITRLCETKMGREAYLKKIDQIKPLKKH